MKRKAGFNLLNELKASFKDVLANLTMTLETEKDLMYGVLASQLEDRIISAMNKNVFIDSFEYPKMIQFDPENPMMSIFKVEGKKYTLRHLPKHYDTLKLRHEGRAGILDDIKGAYGSWYADHGEALKILNEDVKPSKSTFRKMMDMVKRYSKLLWRLLTTVVSFTAVYVAVMKISAIVMKIYQFAGTDSMERIPPSQLKGMLIAAAIPVVIFKVMKLIESAFNKRKVNLDKFESQAKTSSQFPEISRFLMTYEAKLLG